MTKSLKDELNNYANLNPIRFHMPGHNGEEISPIYASAKYDVTELGFNDNLNCPTSVIQKLENDLAEFCGVDKSLISTAGTTTSILIGIGALKIAGKIIGIDQFSHKSVFEAARHWGYKIKIIPRKFSKEGLPLPMEENDLKSFLENNNDVKVISLTSPDYFGTILNNNLYKIAQDFGCKIFVDSAHGAHYRLYKGLTSATTYADVVAESLHKTLPVYTGGSILNIKDKTGSIIDRAIMIRSKVHTTSPSYITMLSINTALEYQKTWISDKTYDKIYAKKLEIIKAHPNFEYLGNFEDPCKLTLNAKYEDFVAKGIYPETSFGRFTNFIITPFNMDKLDVLNEVLFKIKPVKKIASVKIPKVPRVLPKSIPNDATIKYVDLDDAIGSISAMDVGAYPPGVPILYEGQKITKAHIEFLKKLSKDTFNLNQGKIAILNS